VAVDVTTPGVPLEVRGDPLLLRAMVRNLVDNALRFSPDAAHVQLGVGRGEGRVRIVVEDAGPGVAPALRERIFDRFFRGEEPRGAGSGLGLAIVRRAAELHGGSARAAASEALGGLRVEVELPEAT
jgi:signal transduction histidine kinase